MCSEINGFLLCFKMGKVPLETQSFAHSSAAMSSTPNRYEVIIKLFLCKVADFYDIWQPSNIHCFKYSLLSENLCDNTQFYKWKTLFICMWLHYDYRMITRIAAQTDNIFFLNWICVTLYLYCHKVRMYMPLSICTSHPAVCTVSAQYWCVAACCSAGVDLCPVIPACCCSCFRQRLLAAYPGDCLLSIGCRTD